MVRSVSAIKSLRTNAKNACARTAIRRKTASHFSNAFGSACRYPVSLANTSSVAAPSTTRAGSLEATCGNVMPALRSHRWHRAFKDKSGLSPKQEHRRASGISVPPAYQLVSRQELPGTRELIFFMCFFFAQLNECPQLKPIDLLQGVGKTEKRSIFFPPGAFSREYSGAI